MVEHFISSAKGCGFNSQGTHILTKKNQCITWMHCKSLWIKSAKCINVNDSWAPNQHNKIISEGSCDTKAWSSYSLKSSYTFENIFKLKTFKLFLIVIIFHNITVFFCIFDQINAALMSKRDFQEHQKKLYPPELLKGTLNTFSINMDRKRETKSLESKQKNDRHKTDKCM